MMKFFLGVGIVVIGAIFVIKTEWFLSNFGRVEWAEEHLGVEGGSRLFYKLIGILIIILGFLVMTGLWNDLMESFTGLFIR